MYEVRSSSYRQNTSHYPRWGPQVGHISSILLREFENVTLQVRTCKPLWAPQHYRNACTYLSAYSLIGSNLSEIPRAGYRSIPKERLLP
nr:hypothetical protein Q903MT_gene4858 [Picea sitchensis]